MSPGFSPTCFNPRWERTGLSQSFQSPRADTDGPSFHVKPSLKHAMLRTIAWTGAWAHSWIWDWQGSVILSGCHGLGVEAEQFLKGKPE